MNADFSDKMKRFFPFATLAGLAVTDQAVVSGLNFVVAIYLARALGIQAFGSFTVVLVLLFFFLELFRSVIIAPMLTFAAKNEARHYIDSVLILGFFAAVIMGFIALSFSALAAGIFPQWGIDGAVKSIFWLVTGRLLQETMRRYLFLDGRPGTALSMDIVVSLIIVSGIGVLQWSNRLNLGNVVAVHSVGYCLSAFCNYLFSTRIRLKSFNRVHLTQVFWQHWEFGRWLVAGAMAMYASSNLLLLMVATIIGSDAAGLVKAAQYTMGGMIVLFQAVENIIPFRLSYHVKHKNKKGLQESLQISFIAMMGFCALHGVLIYAFCDQIAAWLNVAQFSEFKTLVVINIFFSAVLVAGYCLQYTLRAFEKTKPIFIANGVTACLSIAFGAVIIQWAGVVGVVYGFVAFQIILCAIYAWALRRPWKAMA